MADQVVLTLVGEDGSTTGRRAVPLPATLGRDPSQVDVAIEDRMVSRRHARLEADGTEVVVVDLGSGNGTWIGDEEVRRRVLVPGEVITVGSTTVRWSVPWTPLPESDLGPAWCLVLRDGRLHALPLRDLLAAWVGAARSAEGLADAAALRVFVEHELVPLAEQTVTACLPDVAPATVGAALAGGRLEPDLDGVASLASALRTGAEVFGRHGRSTITDGAGPLLAALQAAAAALRIPLPGSTTPAGWASMQ